MAKPRFPKVTFARVVGGAAILVLASTGVAYAGAQITGKDIKNGTVTTSDLRDGTVKGKDVRDSSLSGADVRNGSINGDDVADGSLTATDLGDDSVGPDEIVSEGVSSGEIADGAVNAAKILDETITGADVQDDTLTGDDVQDGSLTNEDVGAFFAQVDANGTLAGASNSGTTASKLATGIYEVVFTQPVSDCGLSVTIGEANVGSAIPGQAGITDRAGNVSGVFVRTADAAGAAADQPFQVLVVC